MIKFFLRKNENSDYGLLILRVKNLRLTINSNISTKLKIKNSAWDHRVGVLKKYNDKTPVASINNLSYYELNNRLIEIVSMLSAAEEDETISVKYAKTVMFKILNREYVEARENPSGNGKITMNDFIENYIHECENGERLKKNSSRILSKSTIETYKRVQNQFKFYQKSRHKTVDFDDVTINFCDDFKKFFVEKNCVQNTIAKNIRIMKVFLHAAQEMKLTTTKDFESSHFSCNFVSVDNVYLNDEQIKELYEYDLSNKKYLENSRDIFIVGCLTGQRVSDFRRINSEMIERLRDGNEYIHIQQQKTGKWIYVPLDIRVKKILNKYKGVLPVISEQTLNVYIKKIAESMGWTWKAGIKERKGTLEYESGKRFCDCIKTHTARRSFATNAYKNNVPLSSIMAITGHSTETMLRKYLKLDEEEKAMLALRDFQAVIKKRAL